MNNDISVESVRKLTLERQKTDSVTELSHKSSLTLPYW